MTEQTYDSTAAIRRRVAARTAHAAIVAAFVALLAGRAEAMNQTVTEPATHLAPSPQATTRDVAVATLAAMDGCVPTFRPVHQAKCPGAEQIYFRSRLRHKKYADQIRARKYMALKTNVKGKEISQ